MSEDKKTVAFAWYAEKDYEKLITQSESQEGLFETYAEWKKDARRALVHFKRRGLRPKRVVIDVDEYLEWCDTRDKPVNKASREMFKTIKRQSYYAQRKRRKAKLEEEQSESNSDQDDQK